MWDAEVYPLSLLIAVFSGVWPYLKIIMMLVSETVRPAQLTNTPCPTDKNTPRDRDWTECWGRWADEGELGPLVASTEEMLLPAMGPRC